MWLDFVLGIIIAGCVIYSFIRGAIREVFVLGGLIGGIFAATRLYKPFAVVLPIHNQKVAIVVSFVCIFIIVAVIINLTGLIIRKLTHFLGAGFIDRILGMILGFMIGTLVSGFICLGMSSFEVGKRALTKSKFAPFLFKELYFIKGLFPQDIQPLLRWHTPRG